MLKCVECKAKVDKLNFNHHFCSKECVQKFVRRDCTHPRAESTKIEDKLICNNCGMILATGLGNFKAKVDPSEVIGRIKYEIEQ